MLKRVLILWLIAVLAIVVGGCTSLMPIKTGVDTEDSREAPEASPIAVGRVQTLDDLLAEVAKRVPAFGGMFLDEQDNLTVYSLDLGSSAAVATQTAIKAVFGDDERFQRPIRVLQGQYNFLQLKKWHDRLVTDVLRASGVILTEIDDGKKMHSAEGQEAAHPLAGGRIQCSGWRNGALEAQGEEHQQPLHRADSRRPPRA